MTREGSDASTRMLDVGNVRNAPMAVLNVDVPTNDILNALAVNCTKLAFMDIQVLPYTTFA